MNDKEQEKLISDIQSLTVNGEVEPLIMAKDAGYLADLLLSRGYRPIGDRDKDWIKALVRIGIMTDSLEGLSRLEKIGNTSK